MMMNRITRESMKFIAEELIYMIETCRHDDNTLINDIIEFLESEGIVDVIDDDD